MYLIFGAKFSLSPPRVCGTQNVAPSHLSPPLTFSANAEAAWKTSSDKGCTLYEMTCWRDEKGHGASMVAAERSCIAGVMQSQFHPNLRCTWYHMHPVLTYKFTVRQRSSSLLGMSVITATLNPCDAQC